MNKKQRKNMIAKEALILGIIGTLIGIAIGIIISLVITNILNILISRTLDMQYSIITISREVEFYIKFPVLIFLFIIIIIFVIIYLASFFALRNMDKIPIIDKIKNNQNIKLNKKTIASPQIITKLFKEEGTIAYKNIKRNKLKYKTATVSIAISIWLYLSINGIIFNLYNYREKENEYKDYMIGASNESINRFNEIVDYIKNKKLIKNYFIQYNLIPLTSIEIDENKLTEASRELIKYKQGDGGMMNIRIIGFSKNAYNDILERSGIKELKQDEIIITNTINEKTKYGEKVILTNLKKGDVINYITEDKNYSLKIAKIMDNFEPYIEEKIIYYPTIYILVNEEVLADAINLNNDYWINMYIDTEKPEEIDEIINEFNKNKVSLLESVNGTNLYEKRVSNTSQSTITKIVLYTLTRDIKHNFSFEHI